MNAEEARAEIKRQGRDCVRCEGSGWDRYLLGADAGLTIRGEFYGEGDRRRLPSYSACRDCGGTGKRRP